MISRFFIDRPVLANVLAILFVLIGARGAVRLPVAQYPDVVPPTVQVTTRYPGASAETLMNTVALPIEQQVNGVERHALHAVHQRRDGSTRWSVTFEIGTDLNFAQVLVQNRVSSALAQLPQAVQAQGVMVQKKSHRDPGDRDADLAGRAAATACSCSNYATINLHERDLPRCRASATSTCSASASTRCASGSIRTVLQARGLTPQDVVQAVQQQSQQVAAGQIGAPPAPAGQAFQYTRQRRRAAGRSGRQFGDIIVKIARTAATTRLARGRRGSNSARRPTAQVFTLDGKPAPPGMAIFLTPEANALHVATAVQRQDGGAGPRLPAGRRLCHPVRHHDASSRASIDEVYRTLIEAAVLVLVVILLFLQDWRATLVPATTVPVTIIGAFAAMAALGFTVNLSTLFAIVLAIGIVVDDAIVVVEGAAHHIERGHDAARRGGARDGRAVRPDHRHHAGADVGVPAGRVPARADRADVCAVRAGDRRDRADQRGQRGHAEAHAVRAVAAHAGAAGAAQLRSSAASTRVYEPAGAALWPPDRPA